MVYATYRPVPASQSAVVVRLVTPSHALSVEGTQAVANVRVPVRLGWPIKDVPARTTLETILKTLQKFAQSPMGKLLRNVVTQPVVGIQPLQASATVDLQSKISLGKEPSIHTVLVALIQVYLIATIAAAMLEEVNAQVLLLAMEPLTRDAPVVEQEGKCKCSLHGTE